MDPQDDDDIKFRSVIGLIEKKDFLGAIALLQEIERLNLSHSDRQRAEEYRGQCAQAVAARLSARAHKAYQQGKFLESNAALDEYVAFCLENAPRLEVTKESLLYLLRAREDFKGVQRFSVHEIAVTLLEKTSKMSRIPDTRKFLKTFAGTIALKVVNDSMQ